MTLSSVDISAAFLNAGLDPKQVVVITPPSILIRMGIVAQGTIWLVKKAMYGLREAPRLWEEERDQQLRQAEWKMGKQTCSLVQSTVHPSLWHIVKGNVRAPH